MLYLKKKHFFTAILSVIGVLAFIIIMNFYSENTNANYSNHITVVLDAGHGGVDGGVVGVNTGVKESDLNLKVTYKLKKQFEEAGIKVILTRKTEGGLYGVAVAGFKKRDMNKRREIIENSNADMILSIHMNKFPQPSRRGAQVFYLQNDERGKELSASLQQNLNGLNLKPYSPLAEDFFILKCSKAPSALIECGFLSNPEDEKLLCDEKHQDKLSETIFKGCLEFLAKYSNFAEN